MPKAYYDNTISGFLGTSDETILGRLMISDEFRTTIEQKNSWRSEIEILNGNDEYIQFKKLMELSLDPMVRKQMIQEDIFLSSLIQMLFEIL